MKVIKNTTTLSSLFLLALVLNFNAIADNGKDKENKKSKKECCSTKKDKVECNKSNEKSCNKEKKSCCTTKSKSESNEEKKSEENTK